MASKVTSTTMATGSYDIYRGSAGGVQTVWFCGGRKPSGDGQIHPNTVQSVCAHATRAEARACPAKSGT